MAKLTNRFDATAHDTEQRSEFEDLPLGIYRLEVEATDVIETGPEGARTGSGMKYTASVLEPEEMAGRKFFGFINLENISQQAQEIGQRELASMCRAMGLEGVDDTEDLHFHAYTVKLGMGKPSKKTNPDGTPMYPARVEVKRYFFEDEGELPVPKLDEVQPQKVAAKPAANDNKPAPAQQRPAGSKPWAKRAA